MDGPSKEFTALTATAPWGDYGRILVHGMTAHLARVDGRLQLERTGPFVPGLALSGIGDVIVTTNVRTAIESVGLTGCSFAPVDRAKIVRVPWTEWDPSTPVPPEMPASGKPEDYILGPEHDPELAEVIGELWELVAEPFANVERHSSPLGRFHYRFVVHRGEAPAPDIFSAKNMRYTFISERVAAIVGPDALRWCRRHPAEFP